MNIEKKKQIPLEEAKHEALTTRCDSIIKGTSCGAPSIPRDQPEVNRNPCKNHWAILSTFREAELGRRRKEKGRDSGWILRQTEAGG